MVVMEIECLAPDLCDGMTVGVINNMGGGSMRKSADETYEKC